MEGLKNDSSLEENRPEESPQFRVRDLEMEDYKKGAVDSSSDTVCEPCFECLHEHFYNLIRLFIHVAPVQTGTRKTALHLDSDDYNKGAVNSICKSYYILLMIEDYNKSAVESSEDSVYERSSRCLQGHL